MKRIIVGMVLLLGACSGGDDDVTVDTSGTTGQAAITTTVASDPTTTSEATTTSEVPAASDAARGYFDALALGTTQGGGTALGLAQPDSPAHLYAEHIAALNAESTVPRIGTVTQDGDSLRLCVDANQGSSCTVFADFVADPTSHLLSTFAADGQPLEQRLRGAGQPVTVGPLIVTLRSAYVTTAGVLFVRLDVANTSANTISINTFSSAYVGPDGRQLTAADALGPFEVLDGATVTQIAAFDGGQFGGRLAIDASSSTCCDTYDIEVTVPA